MSRWHSGSVLDQWLEITGSIPAAALSSANLGKLFTNIASSTKQYNLVPAKKLGGNF